MATKKITPVKIQAKEYETNQLQSNLINAITALSNQVVNSPGNGQFISSAFVSGNNVIKHSLGVLPVGYIIISQDAAANFYLVGKTTNTLTLHSSGAVNVSLFTF